MADQTSNTNGSNGSNESDSDDARVKALQKVLAEAVTIQLNGIESILRSFGLDGMAEHITFVARHPEDSDVALTMSSEHTPEGLETVIKIIERAVDVAREKQSEIAAVKESGREGLAEL